MNPYFLLVAACSLIILSYVLQLISSKSNLPSPLLLVLSGISLKTIFLIFDKRIDVPFSYLHILGTIGLIVIVLEGILDLEISINKLKIMGTALLTSVFLVVCSSIIIALLIKFFSQAALFQSYIYAIPLSIISSAIVIPSIYKVPIAKREFMIYESSFSDIIGILIFNFFTYNLENNIQLSVVYFTASLFFMIVFSLVASFLLILFLDKVKGENKNILVLSVLLIIYSTGKIFHLSPLIFIIIFGLSLNVFKESFKEENLFILNPAIDAFGSFRLFTTEISFLIRSFFFFIFGFSINVIHVFNFKVVNVALLITAVIYIFRYFNLKVVLNYKLYPEVLIAPRGLITILLFYSIPEKYLIQNFEEGVLLLIIILTNIFMAIGLLSYKEE